MSDYYTGFGPVPTPVPTPTPDPSPDNNIAQDYRAWENAMAMMGIDMDELQKLLVALKTMKNALFGCQEVINQLMTINGDKTAGLAAVDNVDSDLRNELQQAQTDYNNAVNGYKPDQSDIPPPTPQQIADLQDFIGTMANIQAFLNWQSSLPPDQQVIDPADIANINNATSNVQNAFEGNWGNASNMGTTLNTWIYDVDVGGSTNPDMQNVQNGFQTINQSTSALSTTTNTNLQFTTEEYKQYMGILQSTQDAYLKFTATSVQNQKSN